MRLIDKIIREHIEDVEMAFIEHHCPHEYGLQDSEKFCISGHCNLCWNQELEDSK